MPRVVNIKYIIVQSSIVYSIKHLKLKPRLILTCINPMRVILYLRVTNTGICSIFVQVTCKCTTDAARRGLSIKSWQMFYPHSYYYLTIYTIEISEMAFNRVSLEGCQWSAIFCPASVPPRSQPHGSGRPWTSGSDPAPEPRLQASSEPTPPAHTHIYTYIYIYCYIGHRNTRVKLSALIHLYFKLQEVNSLTLYNLTLPKSDVGSRLCILRV